MYVCSLVNLPYEITVEVTYIYVNTCMYVCVYVCLLLNVPYKITVELTYECVNTCMYVCMLATQFPAFDDRMQVN